MAGSRFITLVCALGLATAACSATRVGPGPAASSPASTTPGSSGPAAASAGATCATVPEPTGITGWGRPAQTPTLTPFLVSNAIACGQSRILFLYLDAKNQPSSQPDRTAKVSFYDLGRDPNKAVATVEGTFVWTIANERGMYVVDVNLPEGGTWGAEFTTEAPGVAAETVRLTFTVRDSLPTVRVGQRVPASKTPTAADVGGDLTKISTDKKPDPAFYSTSVADALAAHKPFMLIFATPKFCTSAQCGPTLERFKAIAAAHPDVTFINVEPYQLKVVDGQLQPILDANSQLQATAVTDQWGLLSEPWIFAVDRNGIARGSYEVTITDKEVESIIPVLTAGG